MVVKNDDILTGMKQHSGLLARAYVAPRAKVLYVALNKNACTSLKWMMARLCEEDLDRFKAGKAAFIDDSESVHNRKLWSNGTRVDKISPELRSQIHPSNGWFIFAVVRDPRVRLFSAWQNRMLIETPNWRRFHKEHWYPRHPLSRESVIEDFEKFVNLFYEEDPNHWLLKKDAHCKSQVDLLAESVIPYSRIYDTSELNILQSDLEKHLGSQGIDKSLSTIPKSNPTPLRPVLELYDNGVKEKIEKIYNQDFEKFGKHWTFNKVEKAKSWTREELSLCEREAVLGRRIAELHSIIKKQGIAIEALNQGRGIKKTVSRIMTKLR